MHVRSAFLVALALAIVPLGVGAQEVPADRSFDLTLFHPQPGPTDYLSIRSVRMSPHRGVGFSLVFDYQDSPLVLVNDNTLKETDGVSYQATTHFLWSFGFFDRLQLGLVLPVVVAQDGEGVQPIRTDAEDLASTAIRDIRIDLKGRILGEEEGFGLGAAVAVILPSGDEDNFAGQSGVGVAPDIIAELRTSRLRLALNLGARFRSEAEIGGGQGSPPTAVGHELAAGAGAAYQLLDPFAVTAESQFLFGLADDAADKPNVESRFGGRYSPDRSGDLHIELGAGIGSFDALGTPTYRIIAGVVYAPLGADGDADGILDRDDQCPDEAEDVDGFDDEDGCPDGDNDRDGLADSADECPDEAEDADEYQDEDGCPDRDNDGDGVTDSDDRCPNEAEDEDEFEDDDGCPDADNDDDGVADSTDRCPAEEEDRDEFEDDDGCPDPDNDGDEVPDADDLCPDAAEDVDQFEDQDGCPDADNDRDGVADADDRCADQPETINGVRDEDGCPDAGAETVVFDGDVVVFRRPVGFTRGSAEVAARLAALLQQAAQRVRARRAVPAPPTVRVTGFADSGQSGDAANALADERAGAVRDALAGAGIPADAIETVAGDATDRPRNVPQFQIEVVPPTPAR